jgi:hypothetical protein
MKYDNSKLYNTKNILGLFETLSNNNTELKSALNFAYHANTIKKWTQVNTSFFFKEKISNANKIKSYRVCFSKTSLHKELSRNIQKELQEVLHENISEIPFLCSEIKGRSMFHEMLIHAENKSTDFRYIKLDIKEYFDNTTIKKIQNFFTRKLNMNKWPAKIFSFLVTIQDPKSKKQYLRRGLPFSGSLAFLANISFFMELYKMCAEYKVSFSLYVDDMFFKAPSSIDYIEFVNKIYALAKHHNIRPNNSKTEVSKINSKRFKFHKLSIRNEILRVTKAMKKDKKGIFNFKNYLMQIKRNNKLIKKIKS